MRAAVDDRKRPPLCVLQQLVRTVVDGRIDARLVARLVARDSPEVARLLLGVEVGQQCIQARPGSLGGNSAGDGRFRDPALLLKYSNY